MEKSSSKKRSSGALATGSLDAFLLEFANAVDFNRLQRDFADLLPPALDVTTLWSRVLKPTPQQARCWALEAYRRLIQEVWQADDGLRPRAEHELKTMLYDALEREGRAQIPKTIRRTASGQYERLEDWNESYADLARRIRPTAFENAIRRLSALDGRTKICANPECGGTRFFIAKRKSQKYCDEECAVQSQLEAKRNWWQEHGNQWRENRKGGKKNGKTKG